MSATVTVTVKQLSCQERLAALRENTFAIAELVAGTPIDQVSILLGHSSIKVTEKHYSP